MGDTGGQAMGLGRSWGDVASQYVSTLPSIMGVTNQQQNLANQANAASNYSLYRGYAPATAAIGQNIADMVQGRQAATQQNIAQQYAPGLAQLTRSTDQIVNPEYYKTMGTANTQAQNLMNSINLNGLSGSERAEVERSLGQSNTATGNLGLDNATNAVKNAMTFGSALQAKRDALGSALQTATNVMAGSKQGFNPLATMSNSGGTNTGSTQFAGAGGGSQAYNFGNSTMGNVSMLGNTAANNYWQAQHANSIQGANEALGINQICCFIMLQGLNGMLPAHVRVCRDYYYTTDHRVATGYKRMAKWLVPLMRRFPTVQRLVNAVMVQPIVRYGGWLTDTTGYEDGYKWRSVKNFWFAIWRML